MTNATCAACGEPVEAGYALCMACAWEAADEDAHEEWRLPGARKNHPPPWGGGGWWSAPDGVRHRRFARVG